MRPEAEIMAGTLFECASEPAYVMDPGESCIVAANDAGCALLGYTREELLATPIARIHPSEAVELEALLERVLRDGRATTIGLTCLTKSGTFLPTEIALHALDLDGRTRILGLVRDRSEHRGPPADDSDGAEPEHRRGRHGRRMRSASESKVTAARETPAARGRVRVERGAKRIRAYLGGELVADTTSPLLVWERPQYPTYYFPAEDVRTDLLVPDGGIVHSPSRGDGHTFALHAGGRSVPTAGIRLDESPFDDLRDTIRLDWDAVDAWFEEDEEVFTHPRDPYTRVDIVPSSRHVRVELDGRVLAETTKPVLLFETGLPVRYYLPRTHVRMDLLTPTDAASHCPYKGRAAYWSLRDGGSHDDIAWSYPTPLPESQKIAGLIAFYPERVDLFVDGELQGRST